MKNKMGLVFYDFEVIGNDFWCVTFIEYTSGKIKTIINDRDELLNFYNKVNDKFILCGYNNRNYDDNILKAIIIGLNPKEISDLLIMEGLKPYQIWTKLEVKEQINNLKLYSYDTMTVRGESLKLLEGMMGSKIKESDVDFNINRPLTKTEIEETIEYNIWDVKQTIKVFEYRRSDFDALFGIIKLFNLPLEYINKTKAQLTAMALGAERLAPTSNPEDYQFINCIKLNKYKWIQDWYDENRSDTMINSKGKEVGKQLVTDVFGLSHTFGVGGLHSAIPKYYKDNSDGSIIVHQDIQSYYPNMMVNHNLLSRAVKNPDKFKEMLETRLKYKAEKNPLQGSLKIAINSAYGILNDQFNSMYDPQRSREVTINCQLLLLDLIEKIEENMSSDEITYIQGNTDGLIFSVKDETSYKKLQDISHEWESRTGFIFEFDRINKIYQKDVNSYVFQFENGKLECKGSYLQFNNPLKNDMSILNDAVREYLINKIPVEKTINECDELIKFQHINKIGKTYYKVLWGDKELKERVIRTFACTKDLPGLFKVKKTINKDGLEVDSIQKVANNSKSVFIDNDDITTKKSPDYLDKEWYINEAIKRLKGFGIKYERRVANDK